MFHHLSVLSSYWAVGSPVVSGSLATYDYYFREALRIADSAPKAGSMTEADFEGIHKNLSEWYDWSKKWSTQISEGLLRDSREEILTVDKEITEKIPDGKRSMLFSMLNHLPKKIQRRSKT